ncbi:hypothetical protein LTR35_017611 [Friedmanniomyces endolithicus]|nr:hypothetical protein LTR35_017611 [Friedmanniomyces endolithicus]KAK0268782.1 hypothetical protein LTS00_017480 [Friedmanniomyces endolithicus]KAK0972105.1 hypothetical protein LTR54_017652 [Friedmanniomyces endolithicus]
MESTVNLPNKSTIKAQTTSAGTSNSPATEVNEIRQTLDGYVLHPAQYSDNAAGLKLSDDGKHILIPQPTDSPEDPLNWSPSKKAITLIIIGYIAALADYTGGTAIITVIPQSSEWNMTAAAVQKAVVGNIFAIGACGLFAVAFANYFGRLPVTLVFLASFFATSVWSATATSFESYLAARILNGFFCSVGQGGALMWIKDLYFFHEHPRAINWVELPIITSPYLGRLITAFIVSGTTWRWAFWLCTILGGIALILTVCFLDETLYARSISQLERVLNGSRIQRLVGIGQARSLHRRSLTESLMRPIVCIIKLPVLLTIIYYFLNFAWVIGVNTTVSIWLTQFYGFTPQGIGYFYFFGIIGPLIGWFAGHWLHDTVGSLYAYRHNGHIDPEARLIIAYPATALLFIAIVIIGFALEHHWHYMVLAVLSAVQTVGAMIVTTAINAYLLDCYPEGSGEVGAWVTASRNWSGFMATFIQIEWVTSAGPATAFGAQAGITAGSIIVLVILQLYGKKLRKRQGRMVFSSEEWSDRAYLF